MANRFWVGGTGSWDDTAGSKWSLTSGGAGGQAVPTSGDNVSFDSNSGLSTVTIENATAVCADINFTGFTGTIAGSFDLDIYGSLTMSSGMAWNYNVGGDGGTITFKSTSTGKTITSAGKDLNSNISFDGIGGGWTLQDSLTSTGGPNGLGALISLVNGSLDTNGKTVNCNSFTSQGSGTRSLVLGSSLINIIGIVSGSPWNISNIHNLTFNSGTSTIKITGSDTSIYNMDFSGNDLTYYNVWITGNYYITDVYGGTSSLVFNDLKIDNSNGLIFLDDTPGLVITVNSFTVGGQSNNLIEIFSNYYEVDLNSSQTVGVFVNGETVSDTNGSTGIVYNTDGDSYLYLRSVYKNFGIGDTITGLTNGAHGVVTGLINYESFATLNKTSGSIICNYVTLNNIHASGGASFTATNSIDYGNNPGWNFPSSSTASHDENSIHTLLATLNSDSVTPVAIKANPNTGALKLSDGTTGSYTSISSTRRDQNQVPCFMAVSSVDGVTPIAIYADQNGNLLVKTQ